MDYDIANRLYRALTRGEDDLLAMAADYDLGRRNAYNYAAVGKLLRGMSGAVSREPGADKVSLRKWLLLADLAGLRVVQKDEDAIRVADKTLAELAAMKPAEVSAWVVAYREIDRQRRAAADERAALRQKLLEKMVEELDDVIERVIDGQPVAARLVLTDASSVSVESVAALA